MEISRRRWAALAGATGALALTLGWSAVGAKGPKKAVDWVALNPKFEGATFVNNADTCRTCHEDGMKTYEHTAHFKAFAAQSPDVTGDCESCHGPRSANVENPTAELAFGDVAKSQSAVCLQCHQGGNRFGWKGGAHASNDVSCTSCHTVMAATSPKALLKKADTSATCYACHQDVRTDMNKMSHHPVRGCKRFAKISRGQDCTFPLDLRKRPPD